MSQAMFKKVFKTQSVQNICGQHLDGRHEQFLPKIVETLESQKYELFLESHGKDDPEDDPTVVTESLDHSDDPDDMSATEIVDLLATKTELELIDPKMAPFVAKIKNSPELLKLLQVI
jgi:hypothetical protein